MDDKILIFQYGNISDLVPDIFVLYLKNDEGKIAELHYDKSNSELSSYEKKDIVFDPLSKRIVVFTGIDPQVFDYISLHDDLFYWKEGRFLYHLLHD